MVAIRELFSQARESDKEAIRIALESAEKAVAKADFANEKRLDLLNEFREQSRDRDNQFFRIDVAETRFHTIIVALDDLKERVSSIEGRFLGLVVTASILSIVTAAFALIRGG